MTERPARPWDRRVRPRKESSPCPRPHCRVRPASAPLCCCAHSPAAAPMAATAALVRRQGPARHRADPGLDDRAAPGLPAPAGPRRARRAGDPLRPGTPPADDCYQLLLGVRRCCRPRWRPPSSAGATEGPLTGLHGLRRAARPALGRAAAGAAAHTRARRARCASNASPQVTVPAGLTPRVLDAEQSNTSLVYGDSYILKVFRRVQPGINPDLELPLALARQGCARRAGDPWPGSVTIAARSRRHSACCSRSCPARPTAGRWRSGRSPSGTGLHRRRRASWAGPPPRCTPRWPPPSPSRAGRAATGALAAAMTERLDATARAVPALLPVRAGLRAAFDALASSSTGAARRPAHPRRPASGPGAARRGRRVVADRLRGRAGPPARRAPPRAARRARCRGDAAAPSTTPPAPRRPWRPEWALRCRDAYCAGYAAGRARPARGTRLLRAYETDKAVYEVLYEARHRPDWLPVPMAAISRLAEPRLNQAAATPPSACRNPSRPRRQNPWQLARPPPPRLPLPGKLGPGRLTVPPAPALDGSDHGAAAVGARITTRTPCWARTRWAAVSRSGCCGRTPRPSPCRRGPARRAARRGRRVCSRRCCRCDAIPAYTLLVTYDGDERRGRGSLPLPALARRAGPASDRRGPARAAVEGARRPPMTHQGVAGTRFTVWAPNARGVRVVGDFNYWDGTAFPMRSLGSSGVWELFLPGIGEGALYKFEITRPDGSHTVRADPMARRTEVPPATASVVTESHHAWGDAEWMAQARRQRPVHEAPFSVYEVHLPSWRPGLTYRQLADAAPRLREGSGLHPRRVHAGRRAPLRRLLGLPGHRLLRADRPGMGSPDDFRYLVDALHRAGIGVIMDWVPAHFPKDDWALAGFDGRAAVRAAGPAPGRAPGLGHPGVRLRPHRGPQLPGGQRRVLVRGVPHRRPAGGRGRLDALPRLLARGRRVDAERARRPGEPRRGRLPPGDERDGLPALPGCRHHRRGVHRLGRRHPRHPPRRPRRLRRSRLRPEVEHGLDARLAGVHRRTSRCTASTTTTR